MSPWLTLLALGSRTRPGCYVNRDDAEQLQLVERIRGAPQFRERELTELLFAQQRAFRENSISNLKMLPYGKLLRAVARITFHRALGLLHVDPEGWKKRRLLHYRGETIDQLREIRGLDKMPTKPIKVRRKD